MLESNVSFTFRLASKDDLDQVKSLLRSFNLPTEHIEDQFSNFFLIFDSCNQLVGCAGLEEYGSFGLLRSVAISKRLQNKQLGSKLVLRMEQLATDLHLSDLYLLTETAEKFFTKHNYSIVPREKVPLEIQNSFEYAVSCKESGIVMKKSLS